MIPKLRLHARLSNSLGAHKQKITNNKKKNLKDIDDICRVDLHLKEYKNPRHFKSIFDHNFHTVNKIEENQAIRLYVQYLSSSSKIDSDIVLRDLKNYILVAQQYYPHYVRKEIVNMLFLPYFFLNSLKHLCLRKKNEQKDVIVDDWFENSTEGFYGQELVGRVNSLWSTLIVNFNTITDIDFKIFASTIPKFLYSFLLAVRAIRKNSIDLRRYTYSFFTKTMKGKTIAKKYRPKLIISGNDNGLFIITAKAAGADVLLIDNGLRWPYFSEFCFKYADYNVSLETDHIFRTRSGQGCYFKHNYTLGSLRLYNYLYTCDKIDLPIFYDVLWISTYTGICNYNSPLNGYYLATDEQKAIRVFNEIIERSGLRAAYQCRYANEISDLQRLGLFNEKITYIEIETKSVYQSIMESKIVLTSWSTACYEAMALGKRVGFINLSGNEYINFIYKDLGIEYTGQNSCSPWDYFKSIRASIPDYHYFIQQSSCYVDELMLVIKAAVNEKKSLLQ
jgi:hypothetical protein